MVFYDVDDDGWGLIPAAFFSPAVARGARDSSRGSAGGGARREGGRKRVGVLVVLVVVVVVLVVVVLVVVVLVVVVVVVILEVVLIVAPNLIQTHPIPLLIYLLSPPTSRLTFSRCSSRCARMS